MDIKHKILKIHKIYKIKNATQISKNKLKLRAFTLEKSLITIHYIPKSLLQF